MAYSNGGIMPYPPVQGNGYTIQSVPNFNQQRPNNVRKVGKHEDEEAGKLFVGGLSWDTTQESLFAYFSRYGEVIDCVVMKNSNTNRSRGFGFVTFADPSKIEAVLAHCPHSLDGRTIDPKSCNPRSMQKPKKSNGYPKVFLGGLPSTITETDLRSFFSNYGEVCEVVIMYDQEKKKSRGFGFLSFENEIARERAVADHFVMIQNKQVEIKRAEPRTFHVNGNSVKEQQISEQWVVQQQNGHAPSPMAPPPPPPPHQPPPAPAPAPAPVAHAPNGWTPNASYPAQYGSPPTMPPAQWSQPPPTPPTQWATYASPPPPSSVAPPTFYPAPATPTPSYWAVGQTQSPSSEQQFSQKIGVYAGQIQGSLQPAPAPAPPPAPAAPPPTYPTQYPTIAKAQYPNEFFTTMGGAPAGNVTVTPPMVAYSSALGGPQRGTLFTTQVW